MSSNAERVREFHRAIGSVDPLVPTQPTEAVLCLRRTLVEEESREVSAAFAELQSVHSGDSEAAFHALVHELTDPLYVTHGALVALGVEPDGVFAEVHRANTQKVSGPKREDGKQLKPNDWRPADIPGVLRAQNSHCE